MLPSSTFPPLALHPCTPCGQHMREAAERRQQLELEHEQALAVLNAKQQEIDLLQKVRDLRLLHSHRSRALGFLVWTSCVMSQSTGLKTHTLTKLKVASKTVQPCFHWAVQFSYRTNFFYRAYFGHPSVGVPSVWRVPRGRSYTHRSLLTASRQKAVFKFCCRTVDISVH